MKKGPKKNSRSSLNESDRENGCWPDFSLLKNQQRDFVAVTILLCFYWFIFITPLLRSLFISAIMSALHLYPIPPKLKAIEPNFRFGISKKHLKWRIEFLFFKVAQFYLYQLFFVYNIDYFSRPLNIFKRLSRI